MDQDLNLICHLREVDGLHAVCDGEYIFALYYGGKCKPLNMGPIFITPVSAVV